IHAQIERLGNGPESEAAAVEEALEALQAVPGARLHIQHVSTRAGVDLIRTGKRHALRVTAEATPHHLALTAADVLALGPHGRVDRGWGIVQESRKEHAVCWAAGARTHRDDDVP